ncbi:Efflux transporter, outer membrane factor lipoprotein, NodT family [Burkholderiales bacterium]|nr:Efflux transporter, outer membrane factor lipoprotein, NodT family [Burkholderiales bacterium]
MNILRSFKFSSVVAVSFLSACASVGPDYQRPTVATPVQYKEIEGWKPIAPKLADSDMAWWSIYNDSKLDELERQVTVSNESLKATEASYRQALEIVNESRAGYWPTITANASGQRARAAAAPRISTTQDVVSATLAASWVPDFWGRIRRTVESSVASAQASAADLAAARLSLQSTLATDYFSLRVADDLKRLFEETVTAYQATLDITRNQFEAGTAAETDVITAETELQGAQAQLVGVGVQRAQLEHAIGVLIGKTPDQFSIEPAPLTRDVPVAPVGMPSTLLERRPDIAAAERAAAAASAQIGVAIAAYYPDITLSASGGYLGSALAGLFKAANEVWTVGPQVTETIFNGGLFRAQVAAARAAYDGSVASYRQTVLSAFQQVEDQLAALRILEEQAEIQQRAVVSAREAVRLTIYQYEAGTVAYTSVVTVQAIALTDEQNLLTTLGNRLSASVALVAALGGGWKSEMLADGSRQESVPK